jgi:peptide/nickel transport system substrate-binding protein
MTFNWIQRCRGGASLLAGAAALSLSLAFPLAASAAGPVRGGTLTALWTSEVNTLDPIFTNSPGGHSSIFNLYTENLVDILPSGEIKPVLATEWTWSDDRKSVTFKLRPGVKFTDGTPFDAEAVKFNIQRAADPSLPSISKQYWQNLEALNIIDPMTVQFVFKSPSVAMMAAIASEAGAMMSPVAVRKEGENFARAPVGTGPFKVLGWTSGKIDSVRNPDYWGKDQAGNQLPYLDAVTIRFVPSSAVRLVELRAGSAQLGDYIDSKDFDKVRKDPVLSLVDTHMGVSHFINFNNSKPPFDNFDLRRALSVSIDRAALAKVVSGADGQPLNGISPSTSWANDPKVKIVPYDLAAAKAAYAASGFKGPIGMILIQRDPDGQIAQVLQAMWKQAGIDVQLRVMERQAWMEQVLSGRAEFSLSRTSLPDVDPDITLSDYYGRNATRNYASVKNPKIWEYIEQARLPTSQDERRDLYGKAQQLLVDDQNQIYLYSRPVKYVARKEVQGLTLELGGGAWVYNTVWLAPQG